MKQNRVAREDFPSIATGVSLSSDLVVEMHITFILVIVSPKSRIIW